MALLLLDSDTGRAALALAPAALQLADGQQLSVAGWGATSEGALYLSGETGCHEGEGEWWEIGIKRCGWVCGCVCVCVWGGGGGGGAAPQGARFT